jgi:hypothetical protein
MQATSRSHTKLWKCKCSQLSIDTAVRTPSLVKIIYVLSIYVFVYACVCVCVCVWVRERERERASERTCLSLFLILVSHLLKESLNNQ